MSTATESFIDMLEAAAVPGAPVEIIEEEVIVEVVEKEKVPQKKAPKVEVALNELANLFQDITGEEIQEEVE